MPPFDTASLPKGESILIHVGGAATLAASPTNEKFDLDTSGVAGFFGGSVALSAMVTTHIYTGRRWFGWYNQPGSFEVASRYGQLARGRFWDALYPGPNIDPASLFHFQGSQNGPSYTFVGKMSIIFQSATGHIARLFLDECQDMMPCLSSAGKETAPGSVTVVELHDAPGSRITSAQLQQSMSMKIVAATTVLISLAAAVMCALLDDWYSCSVILFSMACNGIACGVAGRGALEFRLFKPLAPEDLQGRTGILHEGNDIVVMKGPRRTLNAVTQGRFDVRYNSHPKHHDIGCCAVLLSLQLLAQLLVVPQGHLYGQLLFLFSLAVSWAYNSYLSSPDVSTLLRTVLFKQVLHLKCAAVAPGPHKDEEAPQQQVNVKKYKFGTRTSTVVFALLVIAPSTKDRRDLATLLDHFLTDNTPVWLDWKAEVLEHIEKKRVKLDPADPAGRSFRFHFNTRAQDIPEEMHILRDYANVAAEMYRKYRQSPPSKWVLESPTDSSDVLDDKIGVAPSQSP
ncbi:uncharacterized protein TRAVEDRAFT_17071 [Trametes versicolor FP-101664 SS1]|uniref:uncharacterized protein n=1 Tax=Trametes versicolor (strain FP-101664) TaxID=717944 RepID=UPI0004622464|nr:uncharacterized protein TRAVEDRAFT_17071 [Trametes versicolor FP-101664 SS1]EIW65314.1 hypothetical protein TRAVEDRAFT_17071 [Trametes versicolor FP-101664 SS1]